MKDLIKKIIKQNTTIIDLIKKRMKGNEIKLPVMMSGIRVKFLIDDIIYIFPKYRDYKILSYTGYRQDHKGYEENTISEISFKHLIKHFPELKKRIVKKDESIILKYESKLKDKIHDALELNKDGIFKYLFAVSQASDCEKTRSILSYDNSRFHFKKDCLDDVGREINRWLSYYLETHNDSEKRDKK